MKNCCLFIALILLLSGCGNAEPEWPGYHGEEETYTFCHTLERDRMWEEDILYLAQMCLQTHPYLMEGNCWTDVYQEPFGKKVSEFRQDIFDPQRKEAFLKSVNDLILRIPDLTDIQLAYEARRLVASIGDIHSSVQPFKPGEMIFPIVFAHFPVEQGFALHAVRVPKNQEDILLGRLVSINGIPTDQILQALSPYVGGENEYYLPFGLADGRNISLLSYRNALYAAGVLEENAEKALYTFETEQGVVEAELAAIPAEDYAALKLVCHPMSKDSALAFSKPDHYWYQWIEDGIMYIRLASMSEQENYSFHRFESELRRELSAAEGKLHLILDFRNNTGGPPHEQIWSSFVQSVKACQIGSIHILINGKCISSGVAAPYQLAQALPEVILVGSPTAQFPNSAAGQLQYQLPNSGHPFFLSQKMFFFAPGQTGDAVHPDLLIYQTLDDYCNGVDTVLETVLAELESS